MTDDDRTAFLAAAAARQEVRLTVGGTTLTFGHPIGVDALVHFKPRGNNHVLSLGLADVTDVRLLPIARPA